MSKTSMHYGHVLGLDPSGSYNEGKGTTGWCILDDNNCAIDSGDLKAVDYETQQEYWQAHQRLVENFITTYPDGIVVIEDYLLYASKATQQINSRMETPQLLGILKYLFESQRIPYVVQTASEVKKRWTEEILIWKHILIKDVGYHGKYYIIKSDSTCIPLDRHARDALKHAVHFNTFKNKEK